MSAKDLLSASRTDAFRISVEMSPEILDRLDLRLVQSIKRTGDSIEVKFADLAKLCELSLREQEFAQAAENPAQPSGIDILREIMQKTADALPRRSAGYVSE